MKRVKEQVQGHIEGQVRTRVDARVRFLDRYLVRNRMAQVVANQLWGKILDPVWAQLRRPK